MLPTSRYFWVAWCMPVTTQHQSTSRVSICSGKFLMYFQQRGTCWSQYHTDKAQWINTERLRWAKYFSVPIAEQMPDGFPVKTLAVQRALCSVAQKAPSKLPSVIEALYHSLWIERNSKIGEPEVFVPVLEAILGKQTTQEILSAVSFLVFHFVTLNNWPASTRRLKQISKPFWIQTQITLSRLGLLVSHGLSALTQMATRRDSGVSIILDKWLTFWGWIAVGNQVSKPFCDIPKVFSRLSEIPVVFVRICYTRTKIYTKYIK